MPIRRDVKSRPDRDKCGLRGWFGRRRQQVSGQDAQAGCTHSRLDGVRNPGTVQIPRRSRDLGEGVCRRFFVTAPAPGTPPWQKGSSCGGQAVKLFCYSTGGRL